MQFPTGGQFESTIYLARFLRATAYMLRAHNAIAISSVSPSVRPFVRLSTKYAKTVEVRIIQFSPHSSPIPLVFVR